MEKEYHCSIAKFNVVVSPYLSSIFEEYEISQKDNRIIYRSKEKSGTRAIVTPIIEIKKGGKAKLVDRVIIRLVHQEKAKELEALIN